MLHLLNSAVMPAPGTYVARHISEDEFVRRLQDALEFVSSVGYEQTASWIEQISGVVVPLSRQPTLLLDADEMLVCRLAYRVNPRSKGRLQSEEWEYLLVTYRAPENL